MAENRQPKKVKSPKDQYKAGFPPRRTEQSKIKWECSLDVPLWKRYYTTPTFLGTDGEEPELEIPFKCTVPKYVCNARQRALGLPEKVPYADDEPPIPEKPTVYPCWANTIHPAYHTASRNGKILEYYKFGNTQEQEEPPLECDEPAEPIPPPPPRWRDLPRQDITREKGRCHISSYMNDYTDPYGRDLYAGDKKKIGNPERKKSEVVEVSWPAFPEITRETICKQTGRVMASNLDVKNDSCDQKKQPSSQNLQAKNGPCKCAANKNINTSAIGVQSLKDFNICRCGSFSTKHQNTIKDLVKIKQHHQDTIQEAASEIYKKTLPPWSVMNPSGGYRVFVTAKDTMSFDHDRHSYKPTNHSKQFKAFQDDIGNRWINYALDEIEGERQNRKKLQEQSYMQAFDKAIEQQTKSKYPKSLRMPLAESRPHTAPASTTWYPNFNERDERYAAMIAASNKRQDQQEEKIVSMEEQRTSAATKFADKSKENENYEVKINPDPAHFTPDVKFSSPKLFEPVKYEGPGSNQRYGSPFKSITSKRYQLMQPEPIPGLRDTRHQFNKEYFFNYHPSVFR